jgi:hypothetical protein
MVLARAPGLPALALPPPLWVLVEAQAPPRQPPVAAAAAERALPRLGLAQAPPRLGLAQAPPRLGLAQAQQRVLAQARVP